MGLRIGFLICRNDVAPHRLQNSIMSPQSTAVHIATAPRMNNDELMLFALDASRGFGEAVSRKLGTPLSAHEERDFEDGEHKTRPLVNVREITLLVCAQRC